MAENNAVLSTDEIIGHEQNIATLLKTVKLKKVAHAYLFMGPAGVGKLTTALAFARALLCLSPVEGKSCNHCRHCQQVNTGNHPDLHIIKPSGATIKLEQIHLLQKNVYYRSYQGGRQVYIIEDCDTMTLEAANALLKTLEEPPGNTVFLLVSSRPYGILPTIQSRCQQLWFKPMSVEQITEGLKRYSSVNDRDAQMIASMAGGSLGQALNLIEGDITERRRKMLDILQKTCQGDLVELLKESAILSNDRTTALEFVRLMQLWLRDLLVWQKTKDISLIINSDLINMINDWTEKYTLDGLLEMIEEGEKAASRLEAKGNVRLVLDALLLKLAVT